MHLFLKEESSVCDCNTVAVFPINLPDPSWELPKHILPWRGWGGAGARLALECQLKCAEGWQSGTTQSRHVGSAQANNISAFFPGCASQQHPLAKRHGRESAACADNRFGSIHLPAMGNAETLEVPCKWVHAFVLETCRP